jgi:hypothetical protein
LVAQALLNKSMPKSLAHISGLKHLVELKLEAAEDGGKGGKNGDDGQNGGVRFACPITGLPFNGKSRFVVFKKSGHVLSERALKEVRCACCAIRLVPPAVPAVPAVPVGPLCQRSMLPRLLS